MRHCNFNLVLKLRGGLLFWLKVVILCGFTTLVNATELNDNTKRTHRYSVVFDKKLESAAVKLCFQGKAPDYLAVDFKRANKNLLEFPKANKGYIEVLGRYWKTAALAENACIDYQVSIKEHLVNHRVKTLKAKGDGKEGMKPLSFQRDNTWLWLPEKHSEDERTVIHFELPKDVALSTPWKRFENSANQFIVGRPSHDWGFTIAVGQFEQNYIDVDSQSTLDISQVSPLQQADKINRWIESVALSLKRYLGHFPVTKAQVILIENSRFKSGPVPWGEVNRGGGLGIRFVVNSHLPIERFYQDWTASHEFAHLLLPKVEYKDSWLSEGLASYLQYLLMAQAGQIEPSAAWQKLYDGLRRGEKGAALMGNEPFAKTIHGGRRSQGWRSGRTMRIYWTGAAYFFILDSQLLEASKGEYGLKNVLSELSHCCLNDAKLWTGESLTQKLDLISNTKLFNQLYRETIESGDFPEYQVAFQRLSIVLKNGEVIPKDGKGALLRKKLDSRP